METIVRETIINRTIRAALTNKLKFCVSALLDAVFHTQVITVLVAGRVISYVRLQSMTMSH